MIVLGNLLVWWLLSASGGNDPYPIEPVDDFSPMLFVMAMIGIAVILILVGVGIALAVVVIALAAGLGVIGVFSSAALIGVLRRRLSSGLRALHYQVFALAALPAGMGLVWLGGRLFHSTISSAGLLAIGACSGIAAGLVLAFMLDRLAGYAHRCLFGAESHSGHGQ